MQRGAMPDLYSIEKHERDVISSSSLVMILMKIDISGLPSWLSILKPAYEVYDEFWAKNQFQGLVDGLKFLILFNPICFDQAKAFLNIYQKWDMSRLEQQKQPVQNQFEQLVVLVGTAVDVANCYFQSVGRETDIHKTIAATCKDLKIDLNLKRSNGEFAANTLETVTLSGEAIKLSEANIPLLKLLLECNARFHYRVDASFTLNILMEKGEIELLANLVEAGMFDPGLPPYRGNITQTPFTPTHLKTLLGQSCFEDMSHKTSKERIEAWIKKCEGRKAIKALPHSHPCAQAPQLQSTQVISVEAKYQPFYA